MIKSSKNRTFDKFLELLNTNTHNVTFGGNCWFKFDRSGQTYDFEIVSLNENALEYTLSEYIAVVDIQDIEVPYVQANKQNDYEREFYIAIKIERQHHPITNEIIIEFNEEDDRFQAVLETVNNIKNTLTYTDTIDQDGTNVTYKNTFKIREPKKAGIFKWSSNYYQILTVSMNLTSIEKGWFGNETKLYFGLATDSSFGETEDYLLDFKQFNEVVGKTPYVTSNSNETEETYDTTKRTWTATLTVNFNGNTADLLLYDELSAQAGINTIYQIKITNKSLNTFAGENKDYTYNCIVTSINGIKENNMVQDFTFTLERA